MLSLLMVKEALASYVMDHDDACQCICCRAYRGDEQAMAIIIAEVTREDAPRP